MRNHHRRKDRVSGLGSALLASYEPNDLQGGLPYTKRGAMTDHIAPLFFMHTLSMYITNLVLFLFDRIDLSADQRKDNTHNYHHNARPAGDADHCPEIAHNARAIRFQIIFRSP